VAFAAVFPLTARERSTVQVVIVLALVQVVLHEMLPTMVMAGHGHGVFGMVVAHGWATVLTGLWLAQGEAVLW
jgi:hypothetical protein